MTNILDMPDEILILLFGRYLNLADLTRVSISCKKFYHLIEEYKLFDKFLQSFPLLEFNFPYGFSDDLLNSLKYITEYSNRAKINIYQNLKKNNFDAKVSKVFYSYSEKMLPHIQLDVFDDQTDITSLLLTDANKIFRIDTNRIQSYIPTKLQKRQLKSNELNFTTSNNKNLNSIAHLECWKIFERDRDIKSFRKKDNFLVSFSNDKLLVHELSTEFSSQITLVKELNDTRINCTDFSLKLNKLVYGCSNGLLKVFNINEESEELNLVKSSVLTDRILRCVISPSQKNLAIGCAGVKPHGPLISCPLRIYEFERMIETSVLNLSRESSFRVGAGVLALNYIDENTLISSGYDTFIRTFDLRTNRCVQNLEEPEDYSIYCLCSSQSYGLLSGLDRYGIIRYWDRRFSNKIVKSYNTTNSNSSVYSLACTPNNIYAGWDRGVTVIQLT